MFEKVKLMFRTKPSKVDDIVIYFLHSCSQDKRLSLHLLIRLLYLTDWRSVITQGQQITNLKWEVFVKPFGLQFLSTVQLRFILNKSKVLTIEKDPNFYGTNKKIITIKDNKYIPTFIEEEMKVLNHVSETVKKIDFSNLLRLVRSTYPFVKNRKKEETFIIDMHREAEEYLVWKKNNI
ncbi:MAG: type II toxin-antitoxin system antitoxin SocA domain-containing protein [bacterium]